MKLTKRILSVMLVLSMVLAMCPAIIFAEETESTTVEAVKLTNLGYAAQETGLKGMSGTDNVHYLSDLYNNPNYMVDQLNSKVVLDQNYNGDLYTFDGSSATNSARKQIAANLTNGFRTLANGITYRKSDIALGAYGVKYEKGLGVHPDAVGSADRYIIYNVSDLDVDHFYAVVGGTGTNITDLTITNQLVTFELWGATAVDGEYTKLAYAEKIRAYLVAEFDVDITGYNYIKLVVKMTSGSNSSCAVAWGNACVYRKNQPETITYSTLNRQTLLKGKAANAANVQYLSDLYSTNVVANTNSSVKLDKNYNDSLFAFVNGSRAQIAGHAETDANGNRTITANGVEYTFNKSEIAMGHTSVHFEKGLGVHPNGVGAADRYLVYDVRGLGADYFYAVAGATGSNITNPSATNRKVIFELWGSKSESYDENGFVKLAYVDQIRAYLLGEFNVKITGYNFIKLVVKMNSASVDNSSCAVAWGDACVYKDPYAATDNFTNHPATTGNALIPLYETYHACAPVVSLADTSKVKASYVMPASGSTDPRAVGVKKIFNGTTTSVGVGYPNTTYDSFLSLHVSASTHASDTYAILDVQGLGDRFYSLVGIYGEARKATTYGAVYRVYGSKADTYDADAYELLACSGAIYGYNTGVFDVDITGYNFLKLEVARPEGQTANNSSAVAWINPAVYSNTLVHTEETITGSAPTCEGTGLSDGVKCSVCGEILTKQEEIPANGHAWNDGEITTAPGCESEGVKTYTCGTCGETKTEAVDPNGHDWNDATCTDPQTCKNCDATQGEALGHSWNDGVITTAPGCESEGVKTYTCGTCGETKTEAVDPNGHSWKDATCTDPETCSVCGATQGEALGHDWDEGVINPAPDCTNAGVKTYTCDLCGETKTEAVDPNGHSWKDATCTDPETCSVCGATQGEALGHSWNEGEITTAPDCENEGVKTYTCDLCGETKTEAVAATGHTEVADEAVAPGCESTGLTAGSHCDVCGTVIVAQEVIPATGHAWNEGEITTAPGCESEGVKTYTCDLCGETKTEAVAPNGHSWNDATCTAPKTCGTCGATEGNALDHAWDEGVVTQAPTVDAEGVMTYTCDLCGATYTESIDKLDPPAGEEAFVKVTDGNLVSGQYVMITPNGYAPGVYSNKWLTAVQPTVADNKVTDTKNAVWTLVVNGNSVTLQDSAGNFVKPSGGNTNGITTGSYNWSWSYDSAKGGFIFSGTGNDTVILAGNTSSGNQYRGYKSSTATGNAKTYPHVFTMYLLTTVDAPVEPPVVDPDTCDHSWDSGVVTQEPTVDAEGVMTYTCDLCGETKTESIDKLEPVVLDTFVKVTKAPTNWAGTYLLVYEVEDGTIMIFNGTLADPDVSSNFVTGSLVDGKLAVEKKYALTVAAIDDGYSIQTSTGLYIGNTSDTNDLKWHATTTYLNTLGLDEDGNAVIISGGTYMRYNATSGQDRFRYFKSGSYTNQKAVYLYQLESEVPAECPHDWNDGEITTAPGCETEGVKTYTCDLCGETKTEAVAATGHTEVADEAVAPGCESAGLTAGSHCDVCGTVIVAQEVIPATGHAWNDGEITTAPGCETEGVKTYTCGTCGETKTEAVAPNGHSWNDATCTAPETCSVCGATQGEALGHSWNDGEITTAPGCETEGVKTYTCDLCGETKTEAVAATGHTEVADEAVAPGCESTGLTAGSHCDVCGTVIVAQEVIPATGHAWNDGEITTAPDCVNEGVKTYTCGTCGETKTEAVAPNGHDWNDATCTDPETCSVCGATQGEALGHAWNDGEITTAPGCETEGVKTYTCGTCGETKTEAVAPNGHKLTQVEAKAPTCTEVGWNAYEYCSNCDYTTYVEIPKLVAVAKIGDELYASLAEAVAAAKNGETVVLLADIALETGIVINSGWNVTVDLVGYDITMTVGDVTTTTALFTNKGILTITDSAEEDGEICLTYTGARNGNVSISTIRNESVLNIQGGIVNCNSGNQNISYAIDNFGTINVSGGTVKGGAQDWSIRMFLASTTKDNVLNVTGGSVNYVWAQNTNANANKGTINVTGGHVAYVYVAAANGALCDVSNITLNVNADCTYWEPYLASNNSEYFVENVDGVYRVHEHSYEAVVTDPTCTEQGYTTHTCSCGDSYVDSYVDAKDHAWNDGEITTAPGCETEGVKTYTCGTCGETKTEVVAPNGHDWNDATCIDPETCSVCGATQGEALGHAWNDGEITTAPDCVNEGVKTYTCGTCGETKTEAVAPNGHDWNDATCIDPETCSVCGATQGEALGHAWDDGVVTKDPTTTETGIKTYTCGSCGETKEEILPVIAVGTLEIGSVTLSLDDLVYLHVFYDYVNGGLSREYLEANGGLIYWFDEASAITVPGLTWNESNSRYMGVTNGIAMKDLSDTMMVQSYLQLPDGTYIYSEVTEYSGKKYAESRINKIDALENPSEKELAERDVCIALLNAITAAQNFFDHNAESPANGSLSEDRQNVNFSGDMLNPAAPADANKSPARDSDVFTGRYTSLDLEGRTEISFYFAIDEGVMATAQSSGILFWTEEAYNNAEFLDASNATRDLELEYFESTDRYGAKYPDGFAAKEYETTVYACAYVVDADGNYHYSGVIAYSVETYCNSKINKGAAEAELCKALVVYGEAAKAYFAI